MFRKTYKYYKQDMLLQNEPAVWNGFYSGKTPKALECFEEFKDKAGFQTFFGYKQDGKPVSEDLRKRIQAGECKLKAMPISKSYTRDWKGLQFHTQVMFVDDSIALMREVEVVPAGTFRQRMFAMCGSEWD